MYQGFLQACSGIKDARKYPNIDTVSIFEAKADIQIDRLINILFDISK